MISNELYANKFNEISFNVENHINCNTLERCHIYSSSYKCIRFDTSFDFTKDYADVIFRIHYNKFNIYNFICRSKTLIDPVYKTILQLRNQFFKEKIEILDKKIYLLDAKDQMSIRANRVKLLVHLQKSNMELSKNNFIAQVSKSKPNIQTQFKITTR